METVRIGCVQFLNTLPLIEGLKAWRDAELITAVPSKLIGMLRRGEVDVALASVIDAAGRVGEESPAVTLLPVGAIASDGPTFTVRLFSRGPVQRITRVAADTDSHTSVVLMRVLLKRMYGIDVGVADFDARERVVVGLGGTGVSPVRGAQGRPVTGGTPVPPEPVQPEPVPLEQDGWPEAVLLIGDKVVTDAPPSERYPHQMDLGAAWKELTGLPFVYAVWMCRGGEEGSLKVRAAAAMLDRARRHNATRLGWIVEGRAAEKGWPKDLAGTYLGEYLHYGVGEEEREAVEKFVRWAGEMGLVGSGGVRWAGEPNEQIAKLANGQREAGDRAPVS